MRILAIEVATRPGSIALGESDQLRSMRVLPRQPRTAQTLIPQVHQLLADTNWSLSDLELIAVSSGPGSFTGLRIGIVTAKTLAYALSIPVQAVPTMAAMAWGCVWDAPPPADATIETLIDAQRRQWFQQRFLWRQQQLSEVDSWPRVVDQHSAEAASGDILVAPHGSGLPHSSRRHESTLPIPSAGSIARLGYQLWQQSGGSDLWTLRPQYYRLSAAEEKQLRR